MTRKRGKSEKKKRNTVIPPKYEMVAIGTGQETVTRGIVDRFEGDYAIVEVSDAKGKPFHINVLRIALEKETQEGDCILRDAFGWHTDKAETNRLKKEITDLMDDLFID